MVELEIYAAGVRNIQTVLELDHSLETLPGVRYKIDHNHDIVYFEFEEPVVNVKELMEIFRQLGLEPRVVGQPPVELDGKKTQPLS